MRKISTFGSLWLATFLLLLVMNVSADPKLETPSTSPKSATEILYNGIELPTPWPPQLTKADMTSREPMPVPYLRTPPKVIPVDIGRQLFVDDFLIESTTLTRRYHQPKYHEKSPVLTPETEWEQGKRLSSAAPYSDGVWYDPQDRTFKMWYRASHSETCLALSKDGIKWTRPNLKVVPNSNIVLEANRDTVTVCLDHATKNPEERFKLFIARTKKSPYHLALRVSPDGIKWSEETTVSGLSWDRTTAFWNPFRKVWVASVRGHDHIKPEPVHRLRNYREGKTAVDALAWTQNTDDVSKGNYLPGDLQPWLASDRLDPRHPDPRFQNLEPQLYNLDVFPYESLLVGLFTIWQGPDNETIHKLGINKRNEVFVGFTRDGFHWHRPNRERFLPVSKDPKAWNAGNVQSAGGGCLVVGNELYFYCSGRTMHPTHTVSTGLATMRRDGFASLDAGASAGSITTRPLTFSGHHLFVNLAAAEGELRAEILDMAGNVIAPFTRENCVPVTADQTLQKINWQGVNDLKSLAGKPVRLRFTLKNGSLYSFWFSPDAKGASQGYLAAGGPGYQSHQDTGETRPVD